MEVVSLSETCRVLYQNKVEKWCNLLAFIIRIQERLLSFGQESSVFQFAIQKYKD
jgi:hypothetical protein